MKTIKLFLVAVTATLTLTATAVGRPTVNLMPLSSDKALVSLIAEGATSFELSVENSTGSVVYYRKANNPATGYQKIFDFSNLEPGDYQFNLEANGTKVSQLFSINKAGITTGKTKTSYDPYFTYSNNSLKLSYLNFDQEDLVLSIYDNRQQLVFEKNLGASFAVTTGYDLKNLRNGRYNVVLSSESDNYSFNLVK